MDTADPSPQNAKAQSCGCRVILFLASSLEFEGVNVNGHCKPYEAVDLRMLPEYFRGD